jgi:hypothetical protein
MFYSSSARPFCNLDLQRDGGVLSVHVNLSPDPTAAEAPFEKD